MSEAAVEPAADPVDPAAAPAEPELQQPAEPVVEPATPAQPLIDPDEIEARFAAYEAQNQQLAGMLAQIANGQQPQPHQEQPPPMQLVDEFGQVDPNALLAVLEQREQRQLALMQQVFAPFAQTMAQQRQAEIIGEGEQRLNDVLADDIAKNGEFATDQDADKQARELVHTLAEQGFPQIAARYGGVPNQQGGIDFPTPFAASRAAEQAMVQAASQVRGLLKAAGSAAVNQHVNHNATLAAQRGEPGATAAGLVTADDQILAPGELARRYAAGAQRIAHS